MRIDTLFFLLVTAAVLGASPCAAEVATADVEHVQLELISPVSVVRPGEALYLGLRQRIAPGWHTYWRNPGEAGLATRISWSLPAGWRAGEPIWPAPERMLAAGVASYVYSKEVLLPVPISVPRSAPLGSAVPIEARVDLVVCSDVCIPESATLRLDLPVSAAPAPADSASALDIRTALAAAPQRGTTNALFQANRNSIELFVTGVAVRGSTSAYFYPYDRGAIREAAPQRVETRGNGLLVSATAGDGVPAILSGVLRLSNGGSVEIAAAPGAIPLSHSEDPDGSPGGFATAFAELVAAGILAFGGGLILNLMPCVFPILSMKAIGLLRHAANRQAARKEGLLFFAGVLATFLALGLTVAAARSVGSDLGWGFQLQSPAVVFILALVLLMSGLCLSGQFEFGTSFQGMGASLVSNRNSTGSFLTGALAVIVATPCTAPLMAPAIGWAATQPIGAELGIFALLAIGFASPYLGLCFAPGILGKLPAPGPWMATVKSALAFPMYASAAWLAWVYAREQGPDGLAALLGAALALSIAGWCWGLAQKSGHRSSRAIAMLAAIGAVALGGIALLSSAPNVSSSNGRQAAETGSNNAWSPALVAKLRARHQPVLVDFSAAWCITCQVNEKLVLDSAAVREAMRRTKTSLLEADWTNGSPAITRELARFGRNGVPLYVVYGRSGQPRVLPQILTAASVERVLEEASRS